MSGAHAKFLPFDPLERYMYLTYGPDKNLVHIHVDGRERLMTNGTMADIIGVRRSKVREWRLRGRLLHTTADRTASALDVHPLVIWGTDYFIGLEDQDELHQLFAS